MPRGVYDRRKTRAAMDKALDSLGSKSKRSEPKSIELTIERVQDLEKAESKLEGARFLVVNTSCQNNEGWFDTTEEALDQIRRLVEDDDADADDIVILEVVAVYDVKMAEPVAEVRSDIEVDW